MPSLREHHKISSVKESNKSDKVRKWRSKMVANTLQCADTTRQVIVDLDTNAMQCNAMQCNVTKSATTVFAKSKSADCRHPKTGKYFAINGNCRRKDQCAYSYPCGKGNAIQDIIEKEIIILKDEVVTLLKINSDIMEWIKDLESKNIEKENEQIKETNERLVVKAKASENNENSDEAEQEQSAQMNSNDPGVVTTPMLETEGDKLMNEKKKKAHKHHLHFKCDKCDYRCKTRCCLMKNTNSKH